MSTPEHPDQPVSLFGNELQSALQDQSFGFQSYSITSTTPYQATASVKLLEGNIIIINLTIEGYRIESGKPSKGSPEGSTFESVENLLHAASPLYEGKRHAAWVGKLEQLLSKVQ